MLYFRASRLTKRREFCYPSLPTSAGSFIFHPMTGGIEYELPCPPPRRINTDNCELCWSSSQFFFFLFTTRINGEFSIALCNVNVALIDLIVLIFIILDLKQKLDVGCCLVVIIEQALFRFELLHEKFSCGIRVSIQVL